MDSNWLPRKGRGVFLKSLTEFFSIYLIITKCFSLNYKRQELKQILKRKKKYKGTEDRYLVHIISLCNCVILFLLSFCLPTSLLLYVILTCCTVFLNYTKIC